MKMYVIRYVETGKYKAGKGRYLVDTLELAGLYKTEAAAKQVVERWGWTGVEHEVLEVDVQVTLTGEDK